MYIKKLVISRPRREWQSYVETPPTLEFGGQWRGTR